MIYGLYLSATGVLTNSYRQDVIANNLANAQTVGFKRSLALFQQRPTEAESGGDHESTDPMLEGIGGGMLATPTAIDFSEGQIEETGENLDVAIHGRGFFAVQDGDQTKLTRNGRFMVDKDGFLTLADGSDHHVLDANHNPIPLGGVPQSLISIDKDGTITAENTILGQVGLLEVPDESQLTPRGRALYSYSEETKDLKPASGQLAAGFLEGANVDPMTEMTQLINCQRQLEANANMIRFQDQTLSRLVNDVGKIG
jgi:flagellar basal-body rod protein FlgF